MRYLYYIIGIIILVTAGLALLTMDKATVEVSKPALVINDRVITQSEMKKMMASKPHDMTDKQYIESLIMNELLIQQALERNIHKEESFRSAIEDYYEQSLIKILLDRKFEDFQAEATDAELEKYKELLGKKVMVTKKIYKTRKEAAKDKKAKVESISGPFAYLSDRLKFILLDLEIKETSEPARTEKGFATYTLERVLEPETDRGSPDFDKKRVRALIADQKKEKLYDRWAAELRQKAKIWRQR